MNRLISLVLLLSLLVLFSTSVYAKEAGIDKVVIERERDLKVSFEVTNAFTEKIDEAIASGIPTSFSFRLELTRKRNLWFDKGVVKRHFKHTVTYDNLREEYSVVLEERGEERIRTSEIAVMKGLMATVEKVQLLPPGVGRKGERHRVSIQAELDAVELPFPLNRLLFFISLWSFKTDWYVEEFVY